MNRLWKPESPLWKLVWLKKFKGEDSSEPVWNTASGRIVIFNAIDAPLQKLRVDFEPIQAGSGDPSPDNVRSITGYPGINVNIARNDNFFIGGDWTRASSVISAPEQPIIFEDDDTEYTYYNIDSNRSCYIFAYDSNGEFVGRNSGSKRSHCTVKRTSFSSGGGTKAYDSIRSLVFKYYSVPTEITPEMITESCRIMLLRGAYDESRQGTYIPGVIDSYTEAFDEVGTVYGGYIDLITGELVVNRGFVTVDGSTYKISGKANTAQTDRVRFYTAANSIPGLNYGSGREADLVVSNILGVPNGESDTLSYTPPLVCAGMYNSQFYFSFPLSYNLETVAEANAWLAEHPIQISYLLRTPQSYQLSPQTISTIRGSNALWSDAGPVTVTYREA